MAITLVQHTAGAASSLGSVTFASPTTAGNVIIVCTESNTDIATAIADTALNSFTEVVHIQNGQSPNQETSIWVATNITANAADQVTVTFSGVDYHAIHISEWSGLSNSAAVNSASASGNSGTASTGAFTVGNGDLVVAMAIMSGGSAAHGTESTLIDTPDGFGLSEYQIISGTSATSTVTGTSNIWGIVAAAFAPAVTVIVEGFAVQFPSAAMRGNDTWWVAPQRLGRQGVEFRAANLADPYRHSMAPIPAWQAGMALKWTPAPLLKQPNVVFRAANLPDPYQDIRLPQAAWQLGMQLSWAPVPALHSHDIVFQAPNQPDPYRYSVPPIPGWQAGMKAWWAPVWLFLRQPNDVFRAANLPDPYRHSMGPIPAIQQGMMLKWTPGILLRTSSAEFSGPPPVVGVDAIVVWRHRAGYQ